MGEFVAGISGRIRGMCNLVAGLVGNLMAGISGHIRGEINGDIRGGDKWAY